MDSDEKTLPLGGDGAIEGEVEEEHRTQDGMTLPVRVRWRPAELAGRRLTVCVARSLCECGRKESFAEMMGRTAVLAALAVVTIGVGKVAATRRFREMST